MNFFGTYSYEIELRNIVLDLDCLKALIKILQDNAMEYNLTIDYKSGETICNRTLCDIENDFLIGRRYIRNLTLTAKGNKSGLKVSVGKDKFNTLEMECDDKNLFLQLKEALREWQDLFKNRNPLNILAPFTVKSEIIRGILSVFLAFFSILPLLISDWQKGLSNNFIEVITVCFYIAGMYYLIIWGLSAIFFHSVEIDIGRNNFKIRRKIANWIMTVIIIPLVLSWIFTFI